MNQCRFITHWTIRNKLHWNLNKIPVIMGPIAYQITIVSIVYSTVCSDADQRKHQSSASLAFVRGIHRGPVNSSHQWPVTLKMFPFDDVIMRLFSARLSTHWSRVTHICVSKLTIIGSDNGLSPGRRSHYLNQCCDIVKWTLRNKLLLNLSRKSYVFFQENPYENGARKMVAISLITCASAIALLSKWPARRSF